MAARRSTHRRATPSRDVKGVAILLIDVINRFDFDGAAPLLRAAKKAAPHIDSLAQRGRDAGVPVIYVNDNFGRWRSDFKSTVRTCTDSGSPGQPVAERLRPHPQDYFVLKPQHSGFYSTTLAPLLDHLGTRTLVLTGFATNLCVLFTANDAHMRGYHVVVPGDCTASNTSALTRSTLAHVRVALHGEVTRERELDLAALGARPAKPRHSAF